MNLSFLKKRDTKGMGMKKAGAWLILKHSQSYNIMGQQRA